METVAALVVREAGDAVRRQRRGDMPVAAAVLGDPVNDDQTRARAGRYDFESWKARSR
jgi:hypothetical protein